MSAQSEILQNKHDILKLKEAGGNADLVGLLFENFLLYAVENWNYAANAGKQTARDLLDGSGGKTVACGTLRDALKILVREQLKLEASDVRQPRFISRQNLKCFDNRVTGNMGNPGSNDFSLGCYWSEHFFLESGGKYYDPCLAAKYSRENGPVLVAMKHIPNATHMVYGGFGRDTILMRSLPNRTSPGFGGVWEVIPIDKSKITKLLNPKEYAAVKLIPGLRGIGL